jgi:hypothetical protein
MKNGAGKSHFQNLFFFLLKFAAWGAKNMSMGYFNQARFFLGSPILELEGLICLKMTIFGFRPPC